VPLEPSQPLPPRKYPARPPRTQKYDPAKTPRPGNRGSRAGPCQTPTPQKRSTNSVEEFTPVDDDGLLALALTVKEHVDSLPEPQQEMLQLRIEGYEPHEIAVKTERSTRTVEWCLQEVRKRLKDMLKA
jgi:DNA-directed RNA polymerase specialized sigma24 family protein